MPRSIPSASVWSPNQRKSAKVLIFQSTGVVLQPYKLTSFLPVSLIHLLMGAPAWVPPDQQLNPVLAARTTVRDAITRSGIGTAIHVAAASSIGRGERI